MISTFKKIIGSPTATADVVDNHLILSLPNAAEPIVWRMALDKIGTAAFEIKQDDKNHVTKLILKPKKGTAEIIAPFQNKQEAVSALMAASNALQKAGPQTSIQQNNSAQQASTTPLQASPKTQHQNSQSETQKWVIAILGALIVIGLYYYLTTLIPDTTIGFEDQATTNFTSSAPQDSVGVPVSADDFLNGL